MNKNTIKQHLSDKFLQEEKPAGLKKVEDVQGEEGKINKDYYKDVEKKMADYDKDSKEEDADGIDPVKFNYSDDEMDYHKEFETLNGMEMLRYDNEPTQAFKERARKAIEGDASMGNKTYTGEENGNTEPVWGASDAEFGKNLIKTIVKSAQKREKAITPLAQFGDDIEVLPKGTKTVGSTRNVAVEGVEPIKRLTFKKEFNGVDNAMQRIPEKFKIDNKVFEMTDTNETYRVRWEGTLNEGKPVILVSSNQKLVNENLNKMKHLMGFKSEDTLGNLKGDERLVENAKFNDILIKTKNLLSENKKEK